MRNGGFEDYVSCPLGIGDFSVSDWYLPTWGTGDYFNSCNSSELAIPTNFEGFQYPYEGDAYVGIASCFKSPNENSREYIECELISDLEANNIYIFSCEVSLANYSAFCMKNLGISLTQFSVGGEFVTEIISDGVVPVVPENYMCDTNKWEKISVLFTASGGERYLTIGQFQTDSNTTFQLSGNSEGDCAYYYIDDVRLEKIDEFPNVITPNGDGVNDEWKVQIPDDVQVTILNRWGDVVVCGSPQSGIFLWNGGNCVDGTYFYTISKGDFKYVGFIQLLR